MIAAARTKALLAEATRLAGDLRRFQTPGTGEPVDPSRVAELSRFLAMKRDMLEVKDFLDLMATSYQAKMSRSAPPQIREVGRLVRPVLGRVRDAEELLYVLGWAQRLLATAERGTERGGAEAAGAGNGEDAMSAGKREPARIFISYASEDAACRAELEKHLKLLEREKIVASWNDRLIGPGKDWRQEIDENMKAAHVFLILVSIDFLSSDYLHDVEMKFALEEHKSGRKRVVPIIVGPVDWEVSGLAQLMPLPRDGLPIDKWEHRDEAWTLVAKELRRLAEEPLCLQTPSSPDVKELVTTLDELLETAPPYVGSVVRGYLELAGRADQSETASLIAIRNVVSGHAAALLASALGETRRPAPPAQHPSFDAWVLNQPLDFIAACKGTDAEEVFCTRQGTIARIVEALRAASEYRSDMNDPQQIIAFRKIIGTLLTVARELLFRTISVLHASSRQDDGTRCLEYHQYDSRGTFETKVRELAEGQADPYKAHCFLTVEKTDSRGTGLLIDLFPWVAVVYVADAARDAAAAEPRIGLLAPCGAPLREGREGELRYHVDGATRAIRDRGGKNPVPPQDIGDGWFAADNPIDPALKECVGSFGFTIQRKIGEGAFGVVYEAVHRARGAHRLALKVFHAGTGIRRSEVARIRREIARMAAASDYHVVRYLGADVEGAVLLEGRYRWITWSSSPASRCRAGACVRAPSASRSVSNLPAVSCRESHGCTGAASFTATCVPRTSSSSARAMAGTPCSWTSGSRDPSPERGDATLLFVREPSFRRSSLRAARADASGRCHDARSLGRRPRGGLDDGLHPRGRQLPEHISDLQHHWAPLLVQWTDEQPDRRPRDAVVMAQDLERFIQSNRTFTVGRTLRDGSFAMGESPIPVRDNLLQVVPPPPYAGLRAWAVRMHTDGELGHGEHVAAAWRELERWGAPMAPLLTWAEEPAAVVFTIGAMQLTRSAPVELGTDSPEPVGCTALNVWTPPAPGVRALATLLIGLLELARALGEARMNVAVSPKHIVVEPSGRVRVIGLHPGRAGSARGDEIMRRVRRSLRSSPCTAVRTSTR